MNLFGKQILADAIHAKPLEPITRWGRGGWQAMGHVQHPADNRTVAQLEQTIEAYAQKIPEVNAFIKELRELSPKHKALVADTIEISTNKAMLMNDIDMLKKVNGKSAMEVLIGDMVEASKTNPEALEFAQAVINNTDTIAAKYALTEMTGGVLKYPQFSEHFAQTKNLVPNFAEQTLGGGYLGTHEKEKNFMDIVKTFIHPDSKPQNIKLVKNLQDASAPIDNIKGLQIDDFIRTDVPVSKLEENISTMPQVAKMLEGKGKDLDAVEYVIKNTNMY